MKNKFKRFKMVMTYSGHERKFRVFRVTWANGHKQFSFGFQPAWFKYKFFMPHSWRLWMLGVVMHYQVSWGGYYPD